jgi:DNA/RNA-binding domain of Phe-tRNA-synthetase-like protein
MGRTTGKKPSSGQALSYRRKKERQQGEKHSLFDTNDDEKTGQD